MRTKSFEKSFANLVLAGGGTLTLYVLFHFLSIPFLTGDQFTRQTAWVAQCSGLVCLVTLLFGSLRLPSTQKIAVAGLFFSLTALLYGAEIVVATSGYGRLQGPLWTIDRASSGTRAQIATLARGFGVTIDSRDQTEIITDLRKQHVDAVPAVMLGPVLDARRPSSKESASDNELMPLGGLANTLTVLCNESGRYVSYESDEHGFRNPRGIWSSGRADLAAVGESFAQGYCVPDGKSFVDLLRDGYPVTLNLGMSGQSSLLQLAAIKEYLAPHAPKTVLWFFSEGIDLPDLYDEVKHPLLMRYLEPTFTQHLITRQPEIEQQLRRFLESAEARKREERIASAGSHLFEKSLGFAKLWNLRETVDALYGTNPADEHGLSMVASSEHNPFSDALQQAQTITHNWGGTLYFVYLPSWKRYNNGEETCELERTKVLTLVKALGIPSIDVHESFNAHNDPLSLFPFRKFGHYNEQGNQVVADTVRKALASRVSHDN